MPTSRTLLDRMHANLAAAGIRLSDADLESIRESPFLASVASFDERSAGWSADVAPDYLDDLGAPHREPSRAIFATHAIAPAGSDESAPGYAYRSEIAEVATRLRARELSPVELTEQALARIGERSEELNVFQQVFEDRALAAARRAEQEIGGGSYRGPLHGVPIAVKDLVAVRGTETTAGSRILAGNVAAFDAAAVERLEAAGAVIVGKTRMSEFAYLPGSSNAHHGPTRNPWDPSRDAGGSSSGSAVAVAERMAFATIGSDTGGSIRIPAAFCGVIGLKPTFGRVSLHGVVPLSWSLDHLGPLTRTVADAALLLGVLAGEDRRDPRSRPGSGFSPASTLAGGLGGVRIGVPRGEHIRSLLGTDEVWSVTERTLSGLEYAGAEVVRIELDELEDLWLLNNAILAIEAAAFHERWLRTRLDEYGEIPRRRLLAAYAHGPGGLVRAQRGRREMRVRLEQRLKGIELLAMPAQPDGAPPLDTPGWTISSGPFNALGWPALSVPIGATAQGLPLGLQVVGKPWADGAVLQAGMAVEAIVVDR
jgi:Asp-tRNA(Asn)/Glu-tRNA(Gln) amidotransferase A subunit family amidase